MHKEDFFDWQELNIEKVATAMETEPWKIREILKFISNEMKKEEEFKKKLHELKDEYEEKERELYEEYWYDLDD